MRIVYFYFQKTLDDVPHIRIMEKLKQLYSIASLIVTRLCSYLTKHRQSVVINGASLLSILAISVVPQDLVLGPLLL